MLRILDRQRYWAFVKAYVICFVSLVDDTLSEECAAEGWNLEFRLVRRDGVPAPGGTSVSATCQLSQNKQVDCPGLP